MSKAILRITSGILAVCGIAAIGVHYAVIPKLESQEITKSYTYTTSTENGLPDDVAQTVEENGKSYVLPADWQSRMKLELENTDHHFFMTKEYEGLSSQQAPETLDADIEGSSVTLVLESADYTPVTKTYSATGEIEYDIPKDEIPQKADITYENENGNKVTVPGTLVDITSKGGSVGTGSQLHATIAMWPDVNSYMVGDKVVGYDPATPCFDGYEEVVAKAAGLSDGSKVVGGTWDGGTYTEDGMVKRDIVWTVQGTGTESVWIGHYVADGSMTTYNAVATYGISTENAGLPESVATDTLYTYSAEVSYTPDFSNSSDIFAKAISVNQNVFLYIGIVLIIFAAILFVVSQNNHHNNNSKFENKKDDVVMAQYAQNIENSILGEDVDHNED